MPKSPASSLFCIANTLKLEGRGQLPEGSHRGWGNPAVGSNLQGNELQQQEAPSLCEFSCCEKENW